MGGINYEYIENYIKNLLPESDGIIKDIEEYAKQNNIPIITPDVYSLIGILIKSKNVKDILEIGTAIGYSAILMAKSIGFEANIISIEKNEILAGIARTNIKKAGLVDNITIIQGEAIEELINIQKNFDMIFVDGAKGQYLDFFNKSIDKLRIGGLFICDNVLFRGMVADKNLLQRRKITIVKRLKKFLEYIMNNDILETAIVPIGDGLSISIKLKEEITNE
ncbi:MAG: O-methyltransferase [Firmicutes bacterium]|nr:O-methyltransferase [Bacillota bacterium]